MQIKTITTVAGVNEIDFSNDSSQSTAHFYWLKNLGDSTLYVSVNPNPIAEKDDVAELPAKGAVSVETDEGIIYILGAGKVEIHRTNSKFCPFDWQSSGSGGGGGESITVDSELSDTSTNPLQNKVTTAAINEVNSTVKTLEAALETKSDINHIHDISASGNPVVMDNLQGGVPFSEMVVSGKNLLKYPYYTTTKTINGVTFTDNGDGTITANGTATAEISFALVWKNIHIPKGTYAISGCPEGGDLSTGFYIVCGTDIIRFSTDVGNGGTFTISEDTNDFTFSIRINSGVTVDNLVFRPQLELGSTPTAYEPPITGRELTLAVSGKNLINNIQATGTVVGVTVTKNDDGTVTINGTTTGDLWLLFDDKCRVVKDKTYTFSMGFDASVGIIFGVRSGDNAQSYLSTGVSGSFVAPETGICRIKGYAKSGITFDNLTIYPQLELGDTATEYEPYHGSTTTITPDSNPYVIPNDIRQQDGLNVVTASEGELSVVGVQKNAAIKRIWDDMGMDLLFDGSVTTGTNCITESINEYNFLYFYGNLSFVSGESGNVTGSLVIPKTARAISAGQSLVLTTGVIYITVNIINIDSGVITFTVTPSDSNREIYEFKIYGIK